MTATPRELWQVTEGLHAVAYFAPEVADAVLGVGVKGWWRGYFAGRAAPMGAVGAAVVTATFANFAPAMVERSIPSAWESASPKVVARARLAGVDAALARIDGADRGLSSAVAPVVDLLDRVAEATALVGRPLAAAWAAHRHEVLDEVGDHLPVALRAWLACTVLREARGDAHVAALAEVGLDGCEAHLTLVGTGRVPAAMMREARGWSEPDWQDATDRLVARGLLHPDGRLTMSGIQTRTAVEDATDRAARRAWGALDEAGRAHVVVALRPVGALTVERAPIRVPNPMGWEPL
jgi:hypothetical protein